MPINNKWGLSGEVINIKTKKCTSCGIEKPLSTDYFHLSKNETKEGFKSTCKVCRNAKNAEYRKNNKDNHKEYYKNNKEKFKNRYEDNKEWYKQYYENNKEKLRRNALNYYEENYKNNKVKYEEYYEKNKEYLKAKARERHNTEEGRLIRRISRQKRKSLIKGTLATFTKRQWEECKKHFNHRCAYCGCGSEQLEQDHFIPLSKGGEYTKQNIIPACRNCNSRKRARDFKTWYSGQTFYSELSEQKILKYLGYEKEKQQISMF